MTDRELLEFAAKAAGKWGADFEIEDGSDRPVFDNDKGFRLAWGCGWWNPLADDGDEARLEAVMGFNVEWRLQQVRVSSRQGGAIESYADHGGDKQKARRRAGVRAAAAIGKEMP